MKKVLKYENEFYQYSLVIIMLCLMVMNLIGLANGLVISLLPMSLQITVLILMALQSPIQKIFIRVWAIIISMAGLMGTAAVFFYLADYALVQKDLHPNVNPFYITMHVGELIIGILYLVKLNKCTKVIEINENQTEESVEAPTNHST